MTSKRAIIITPTDNVATALSDIAAGDRVELIGQNTIPTITAQQHVPFGHKIALTEIEQGASVIKYGEVIGRATKHIRRGEHVHIHNVESLRGRGDITT